MKQFRSHLVVGAFALALAPAVASAQSAKNAVQLSRVALVEATGQQSWTKILETQIKTSQQKDLIIGVSLETGLFTQTLVRSKGGTGDTSKAEATLKIRVTVGNRTAEPGEVTFDKRYQELMAKFGGVLACSDTNGDGIVSFDECVITEEELNLILNTMAAHAFNFVIDDLGAGTHNVIVEAMVDTNASWQLGSASANAAVGKGSLTVEEVRLVKGAELLAP